VLKHKKKHLDRWDKSTLSINIKISDRWNKASALVIIGKGKNMRQGEFKGFGGVKIAADLLGSDDDPAVLLLHDAGQSRADWNDVAQGLLQAGRKVINVDLRPDSSAQIGAVIEDIRAVLAQLGSRPVIVAAGHSGWAAIAALENDAATLASGLVLIGPPAIDDSAPRALLMAAAPQIKLPCLFLTADDSPHELTTFMTDSETIQTESASAGAFEERNELISALLIDFLERRQPLALPEYREGSDARTFRDALGCFATGVTIVTAMDAEGQPIGLTANSFTSVSLDPPLLLVCIAKSSGSAAVLRAADNFAVNVLQIGQQPTSNRFAGKGEDRFANTPWSVGEFGTPVLTGSLSSFECARHNIHDGGDHFLLVGRVLKAMFEPRRDPLLYFRGKYRRLHFA
jgi:flavin reductase (DIM6/NTAB) family NADH-FMN oxidoreductase RutF